MQVQVQAWGSNFDHLAEQMWALMNEMKGRECFRSHAPDVWKPRLNFYETKERYLICVELAGMTPEQIDVRAEEGVLHVLGVRRRPVAPDGPAPARERSTSGGGRSAERQPGGGIGVHLMEIDSGRFRRELPLPSDVDVDGISAIYRQGYLWVILPREVDQA